LTYLLNFYYVYYGTYIVIQFKHKLILITKLASVINLMLLGTYNIRNCKPIDVDIVET